MIEPLGRNDPCPCGSGRKLKRCCGRQAPSGPTPAPPDPATAVDDRECWAGWGYTRAEVRLLLDAAAECFAAAPWATVGPDQPLFLCLPDGEEWLLSIEGPSDDLGGSLHLYEEPEDYFALAAATTLAEPPLTGQRHGLWFETRDQVAPVGQRELLAHGWPHTRGATWPILLVQAPPGADSAPLPAETLAACWRATLAFIRKERPLLASGERPKAMVEFTDPATGITCSYDGVLGDTWDAIWPLPEHLTPALPQGSAARPAAALLTRDPDALGAEMLAMVRRFEERLLAEGMSRRTVRLHAANVERMGGMLAESGVPWAALSELDLRIFLYLDCFDPEAGFSTTALEALPSSLEKLVMVLLEQGIECLWALPILADRAAFAERWETFPAGDTEDGAIEAWVMRLVDDLMDRALLLPHPDWPPDLGPTGLVLEAELTRRVLDWREELIHAGVTRPADVRARLEQRRQAWQETPHPGFPGRTPLEVIRAGE
ncbi:MAG: SEC-C domain-containing protein [Gemmatimonadales bacterium]|nr:SEC-C domain-containing protein [Gemmatimonadales bacterium]